MGRITDIIQQMEKARTPGAKDKQQRKKGPKYTTSDYTHPDVEYHKKNQMLNDRVDSLSSTEKYHREKSQELKNQSPELSQKHLEVADYYKKGIQNRVDLQKPIKKSLDDYVSDMMKSGRLNEPSQEIQIPEETQRRSSKRPGPQATGGKWVKKSEMSLDDYITNEKWR